MSPTLSPAELRAVEGAAAGLSNREIAAFESVSVASVKTRMAMAFAKLGADDREHAAQIAIGAGLLLVGQTAADRRESDRRRMAADPRFAGWVAGAQKDRP